jgi:hypothetical protein
VYGGSTGSSQLVEGAWQLLLEHRCWYEAALWLLVHTVLAAAPVAAAGTWEIDAGITDPTPSTAPAGNTLLAAAQQAAMLVAFVQEPHDIAR